MKDGAVPDLKSWFRRFREVVGGAYVMRGVELTVDGHLVEEGGRLLLQVTEGGLALRLAPLQDKVQWDPERKIPEQPSSSEKGSFARLSSRWAKAKPRGVRLRVVGPMKEGEGGRLPILTVREFTWE